jgi:general secretion pathway protein D
MLGGILEQTETHTVGGTPFLSSVPFLRYFFSDVSKEVVHNEIVFLLIPHIVRRQELDELNTRAFDVGTGPTIELRLGARPLPGAGNGSQSAPPGAAHPSSSPPPAPQAAPQGVPVNTAPVLNPPPAPVQPSQSSPAAAQPAAATSAGATSLRFDASRANPTQGSTFAITVVMAHGQDVASVSARIAYDPKVVQFVSATPGDFAVRNPKNEQLVVEGGQAVVTVN